MVDPIFRVPPPPVGHTIPALEGHSWSPCMLDKYMSKIIIDEMGFTATVHEPCLHYKHDEVDGLTLILRQVDNFEISAKNLTVCDRVRDAIQKQMTFPLNELGVIQKFNGLNRIQAKHYTHLHCKRYIDQIVEHHGWTKGFV